jgi:hypothetical protein
MARGEGTHAHTRPRLEGACSTLASFVSRLVRGAQPMWATEQAAIREAAIC